MRGRNFLERKLSPPPPFSKNFAKGKLLIKEKSTLDQWKSKVERTYFTLFNRRAHCVKL